MQVNIICICLCCVFQIKLIPGDPIRDRITNAILQLQEEDEILNLKIKWWKTGHCASEDGQKEDANELGLENIGGIFIVLIVGLVLGILVAVVEFVWKSRENAEIDRVSEYMQQQQLALADDMSKFHVFFFKCRKVFDFMTLFRIAM